jgi:hypothetical protein
LRESLGNKSSPKATIALLIKHPTILDRSTTFREIDQFVNTTLPQSFEFLQACFDPFLPYISRKLCQILELNRRLNLLSKLKEKII